MIISFVQAVIRPEFSHGHLPPSDDPEDGDVSSVILKKDIICDKSEDGSEEIVELAELPNKNTKFFRVTIEIFN